ncbi:transposase [Aneurinibacillus migulanus]|uniref:transposase n=1 Tax=Aneurinibacillus migulanus TaxID=47500 RepID=UPI00209C9B41|nr:transposase [Aneurinibacillus migulanus]
MKRKKYSFDLKKQVVKEAKEIGNLAVVARRHELSTTMVSRWKREVESGKHGEIDLAIVPSFDGETLLQENDQLKRLLGEQALEIAILHDLIKKKNGSVARFLKVR